jgi:hypothetical protein
MSNSSEIWGRIEQVIESEQLIESEELDKIGRRIESGRINAGDWKLAIENTLLKEEQDA